MMCAEREFGPNRSQLLIMQWSVFTRCIGCDNVTISGATHLLTTGTSYYVVESEASAVGT